MPSCCNKRLDTYYEYFNNDNTISSSCDILHLHDSRCMPRDERNQSTSFIKSKRDNKVDQIKNVLESKATKQVLYILRTWLPSFWYYVLTWLYPKCFSNKYKPNRLWIQVFFKLLLMFHTFITPLLFCWSIDVFRRETLRLVLKIGSDRERNPNEDKTKLSTFSVARLQIDIRTYVKAKHNMNSNAESFV